MEQLQKRKEYWAQHCPALLNTLSVKGLDTIKKISGRALEQTKENLDAHLSQMSHRLSQNVFYFRSVSPL